MQRYANQMPDAFNDATKVIKSHMLAANVPTRINVPVRQNNMAANDLSVTRLKRGRSSDSKGSVLRKKKNMTLLNYCITVTCQMHNSCRKDTCPEKVNPRTWES